ncbi:MAG TPA: MBL fold metallo-hydrolase [Myxococcota bacterium]|nr:MBL fold metallo-hydrolase [Myxococcota bacterium]
MGEPFEQESFGATTVYFGERRGKYPHGNSLVVRGKNETVVVDPSLGLVAREPAARPRADRVLHSHCHEDHIAGSFLYAAAPWHFHEADLPGIASLEALLDLYGYPEPIRSAWAKTVVERFHFTPRADAHAFRGGDVFDLGGARVEVIHAPGHTRGHSFFRVEPDGLVYLADVDLSSFGPYYGDAWSDLEDFERTLALARDLDARWYATFHHIGVIEGREAFLERLARFAAVITDREARLLAYLSEPRSLEDVVRHRFVYRPQDPVAFADAVERRSMSLHLWRLERAGRVERTSPATWLARGR